MLDCRIEFDERYDSVEDGTTTLYFIVPKEMLGDKYSEAEAMEISIEFPTDHPEARYASVAFSPTKYDETEDCYTDYDWFDVELPLNEIEELIALAEKAEKQINQEKFSKREGLAQEKDNIVLDFGNIVSEMETKNLQLLKIKDNNGLFVVDGEGNLYGIETYYAGGYLDRFIGEKFIISFEPMEQPTRDFEDWRKEFMDASWVKSFIERIVKKEYPNFEESNVEDDQIPSCKFNIGDKVKITYISDCNIHNNEVGEVTWIHPFKFFPDGDFNNYVWKHQMEITYPDGQSIMADPDTKTSGIVSEVILVEAKSQCLPLDSVIQSASTRATEAHPIEQQPVKSSSFER